PTAEEAYGDERHHHEGKDLHQPGTAEHGLFPPDPPGDCGCDPQRDMAAPRIPIASTAARMPDEQGAALSVGPFGQGGRELIALLLVRPGPRCHLAPTIAPHEKAWEPPDRRGARASSQGCSCSALLASVIQRALPPAGSDHVRTDHQC